MQDLSRSKVRKGNNLSKNVKIPDNIVDLLDIKENDSFVWTVKFVNSKPILTIRHEKCKFKKPRRYRTSRLPEEENPVGYEEYYVDFEKYE